MTRVRFPPGVLRNLVIVTDCALAQKNKSCVKSQKVLLIVPVSFFGETMMMKTFFSIVLFLGLVDCALAQDQAQALSQLQAADVSQQSAWSEEVEAAGLYVDADMSYLDADLMYQDWSMTNGTSGFIQNLLVSASADLNNGIMEAAQGYTPIADGDFWKDVGWFDYDDQQYPSAFGCAQDAIAYYADACNFFNDAQIKFDNSYTSTQAAIMYMQNNP